jgi:hypothetical protein
MDFSRIRRSLSSSRMFSLELTAGRLLKVYPREGEAEVRLDEVAAVPGRTARRARSAWSGPAWTTRCWSA